MYTHTHANTQTHRTDGGDGKKMGAGGGADGACEQHPRAPPPRSAQSRIAFKTVQIVPLSGGLKNVIRCCPADGAGEQHPRARGPARQPAPPPPPPRRGPSLATLVKSIALQLERGPPSTTAT